LNPKLKGDSLQFSYIDRSEKLSTARLTFTESKVKGEENSGFMVREFSGFRQ
jgi:hypothetical protein